MFEHLIKTLKTSTDSQVEIKKQYHIDVMRLQAQMFIENADLIELILEGEPVSKSDIKNVQKLNKKAYDDVFSKLECLDERRHTFEKIVGFLNSFYEKREMM